MKELFLEIGTEEIPAGYIEPALASLEKVTARLLGDARISHKGMSTYGTPQRMILRVKEVNETQQRLNQTVTGPPTRISFDDKGKPTGAAIGFARKQGVAVEKLKIVKTDRGEYLAHNLVEKGARTKKVLTDLFPKIIHSITFPKTMKWGDGDIRFVRPIHWIVALFGGEIVKFNIGAIKSGNVSIGHRFMAPREFTVKDFNSYLKKTALRYVVIDSKERKKTILKESKVLARKVKGTVLPDAGLLQTLVYLAEYPFPVLGGFDKQYLKLPREVLIAVMKNHQKYLSIVDEKGKLLPHFIAVSNNRVERPKTIRAGYERVLKARLADAKYFYDEDCKQPLDSFVEGLKSVVWQEKLGTLYEKVERVKCLSAYVAESVSPSLKTQVLRAATLSRADLLTRMVYEFPELQGVMGREYARLCKEEKEVCRALFEQYLPRFAGDKLPKSITGAILNLSDKIDSIVGCFGVGLMPTGSEDPLALRRQSLAVMNIIIEKGWTISLNELIEESLKSYEGKPARKQEDIKKDIKTFFIARLKNQLIPTGIPYDAIDAVFSVSFDYLPDDLKKVKALADLKKQPYFESLAITFKRVVNILKGKSYPSPDVSLLTEPAEKALYDESQAIEEKISSLNEKKDYNGALKNIAYIREHVDRFFDEVLVMAEDKQVRENRLGLLCRISGLFSNIADFSKIVVSQK